MTLKLGLAALAVTVAFPAFAQDLTITIENTSSQAVERFFTSPADVDEWEEDVFGDAVLPAGASVEVTIADGRAQCDYDLKFVMEDGQELVDTQDLCGEMTYTLSDN